MFIGPILRIICSQKVTFSKPVTIQLPISLRHEQQEIPDISECRVRVLCQKSAGDHGDWREITSDLRNPASFDGKFVRFQVEHFCKYAKKKKYLQLVAKCLRQCTFTSYFPLPCYQNCKDSTSKRRLVYLPFGGTQQMFIRRGCAPRSNPLPFYMQFFTKKVPVSYTFYWQMVPLSHTLFRTLHPF